MIKKETQGEPFVDADPLACLSDGIDDVDINDPDFGAHAIYAALSNIDLAQTTPEIFWEIFGTPNGKASTVKWLDEAIRKLTEIEQGMPQ
jgi:hypothetical protein